MQKLIKLTGNMYTYKASDTFSKAGHIELLQHFIAPDTLRLKIGAQVMLVKNLSPTLVNGSIGVVESITEEKLPIVKFTNNESRVMSREEWTWEINGEDMQ